jgi:hypothetical protein
MTLADERCCQKEAECGATLGEMALAAKQRCSLSNAQAAESALATAQVTVLADLSLLKPVLTKDKRRQEDATAEQR